MTPARDRAEHAVRELLTSSPSGSSLDDVRRLAALVTVAGEQLQAAVREARRRGHSWDDVAGAVLGRYPSGAVAPLGHLVPGGTSTTTVRRFYVDRGAS